MNGTTQVTPRKAGTAYLDITIRDGSQYNNLSPAKVKITITQAAASREAILTIGSNFFVLDGKTDTFDAVPYIKNDRSFFPIRIVARSLGVAEQDIKWDAATQTVTLKKGSDTVAFTVGKNYYKLNGVILYMDVTTENSNGRVFLPVRYVSDALGGEISWNNFTKSITITTR